MQALPGPDDTRPAEAAGRARAARIVPIAAFLLLCAGLLTLFLAYPTYPNYDSVYGLLWARELWEGHKPVFDAFRAPTQHPATIAFGMLLEPLGRDADRVMLFCSLVSVAVLAAGMYELGRAAFNRWVGLVAGALLVVNWDFLMLAIRGYLDVTYMALVVWAAVLEARRPRRGVPVLVLLALAGLLRPEAWVLCGLYGLWMALGTGLPWRGGLRALVPAALRRVLTRRGIAWLAAGVFPAVVWMVTDYVVTGDPLFSQTHTSGLAEELGRTRGPLEMPFATIAFLKSLDGLPLFVGGLVGLVAAAVIVPTRIALPVVLLATGVVTFLAIGVGGFSVIDRYLLVPAVLLLIFAAFVLVGWTLLPDGGLRTWWSRAAIFAAVGVVVVGISRVDPGVIDDDLTFRGDARQDLVRVLDAPQVRRALRCGPLWTPNHKLVPDSRWILDAPAEKVLPRSLLASLSADGSGADPSPDRAAARRWVPDAAEGGVPRRGVLIVPTSRQALVRQAVVEELIDDPFDAVPLPGFRRIATSTHYSVYARC